MAAATEDRIGASDALAFEDTIVHEQPLATDETIYMKTLITLNGSGEFESLTHSDGDDDSGEVPLVSLDHYDEDLIHTSASHYDRGGTGLRAKGYSGIILELENGDADLSGYSLYSTAYALDDQTVVSSQSSGTSGDSKAPVGPVYEINKNKGTVEVLVQGILNK